MVSLKKEGYVDQPLGYETFNLPNHVFKLKKGFIWFKASS